jgi:hypothetical protein
MLTGVPFVNSVSAVVVAAQEWAKAHRSVMRGDSPLDAAYADLDRTELALLAAVDALEHPED